MSSEQPDLVLKVTRLRFDGRTLTRLNDSGEPCLQLTADLLVEAKYTIGLSWFGVVWLTAALLIGYVGYTVAGSGFLAVLTYVFAIVIGATGMLGIVQDKIRITTTDGRFSINSDDRQDVTRGFAISLNERIRG